MRRVKASSASLLKNASSMGRHPKLGEGIDDI